jgi:hypothetical protein
MPLNIPVVKSLVTYRLEDERFAGTYGEGKRVILDLLDLSDYQGSLERIEMYNPFGSIVNENYENGHKEAFETRTSGVITYYRELKSNIGLLPIPIKVIFEIEYVLTIETGDDEIAFMIGEKVEGFTTE